MRHSIITLMLLCALTLTAQTPTTTRTYCELVGNSGLFSSKVKIYIDFGQETSYWKGDKDQQLVDESGKDIKFNSMVDAMNFMGKFGWKFAQAYTVGDSKNGYVYHWLLYKDINDESEKYDGFMTKEQFKSPRVNKDGVPLDSYKIEYLSRNVGSEEWYVDKHEIRHSLTRDEINDIAKEWEAKTNSKVEYKCQVRKHNK